MKKWYVIAIVFGFLLIVRACSDKNNDGTANTESTEETQDETNTNDADSEGEAVDPEELVESNCASCHGDGFELVPGETNLSVEEIEDIIKNGIGSMPAIDSVTDEEATIIADYLAQE